MLVKCVIKDKEFLSFNAGAGRGQVKATQKMRSRYVSLFVEVYSRNFLNLFYRNLSLTLSLSRNFEV
jgi:hypothetical protein